MATTVRIATFNCENLFARYKFNDPNVSVGDRAATRERRELQAQTVRRIVEDTFGSNMNSAKFLVLGDMNDYMTADPNGTTTGIADLVEWNKVENVVERLPAQDQWTHYYDDDDEYRQLDYILVSKALTPAVQSVDIVRKGMPLRAARYTGPRFPGVGQDRPKASDHCPVVVELLV